MPAEGRFEAFEWHAIWNSPFWGTLKHGASKQGVTTFVLPAVLQKLVGELFRFFAGKFGGQFGGICVTHRIKADIYRGQFRSIFRKKIRSSKKTFVENSLCRHGVTTFAWRPGSQYDVAATRGADNALASNCRAQFGRPSTRRGCRICATVRLPVRPRGETMYPFRYPPFKCALLFPCRR